MLQNMAISVGAFRRLCGQSYGYSLPCAACAEKLSLKVRGRTYGI